MKVWDLDKEYDRFLASILSGRERKRQNIRAVVEEIKGAVLVRKEDALIEYSKRWDRWDKAYPLKLTEKEISDGASRVPKKDLAVLKGMIGNVVSYHRSQKGHNRTYRRKGLVVREEFVPVERALVYVPGGTAAYPSSLIMGVVPAQLAGVKDVIVTTPATDGVVNPYACAASALLGVNNVYRIGGAQAIYAFSYGTGSIPKVDMIVGPGNAFVEEAKRDVYGRVGIDMLAGPTELIIMCTEPFSPKALAWDMLSQAEHDEMAMVGLFSSSQDHLKEVRSSLDVLIAGTKRKAVISKALAENGFMAYFKDAGRAVAAANAIAPEHMELIGDESQSRNILYPGVLYLGPNTTVAMGDYYIGTNHVLPTGGAGRFTGGLSVDRFTKRKVVVRLEKDFLDKYGDNAIRLSQIEGLDAHGEAVRARKEL
jgi:histidinol dehydrogenase